MVACLKGRIIRGGSRRSSLGGAHSLVGGGGESDFGSIC